MSDFSLTIAGQAAPTLATLDVINPATGKVFAQCPDASRGQLDATLESAQEAFRAWRADPGARRAALVKAGEALQAAAASIGRVLTQDVAK